MDPKNKEFIALMKAAGWSQAETARRLRISTASVSEMCSGKIRPSNSTLNLLKLMLAHQKPSSLKLEEGSHGLGLAPWASDLMAELERLPEGDRERLLLIIHQMIKAVKVPVAKAGKGKN